MARQRIHWTFSGRKEPDPFKRQKQHNRQETENDRRNTLTVQ
jgi:hypothetical protein